MTLRELKQKHNEHVQKIKLLNADDKELTAEQKTEIETRYKEAESLKEQIEHREKLKKLELSNCEDDIPKSEKREYSLTKAIECLVSEKTPRCYELEMHEQLEKRSKSSGGFLVPSEEIFGKQKVETRIVDNQSSLVSDPIKPELYLPALYEQSIMGALGVRQINAVGDFNFPRSSSTTAGWVSGDGAGADSTLSSQDQTFTSTSVTPHFLGAITGWSYRQLKMMSSNLSLESILRSNLVMAMAEKLDDSLINSDDATVTYNPKGVLKLLGASTNNTPKDLTGNKKWVWSDLTSAKKDLRVQYKNNLISPKWLIHPDIEKEWSEVQRFTSTDGDSLLESAPGSVVVSSHLANTSALFAQWSELVVCTFSSVELSLGMTGQDFALLNQRLRAVGAWDFFINRPQGFRQFTITR